jgi:hypothetical protein
VSPSPDLDVQLCKYQQCECLYRHHCTRTCGEVVELSHATVAATAVLARNLSGLAAVAIVASGCA